jgi:hypothetical protein
MSSAPRLEALEDRCVPAVDLTSQEQMLLELVNRARANPAGEAARYGIDLNAGLAAETITATPKMPLSPNQLLTTAARSHSVDMLQRNYFDHITPEGKSPLDRVDATGYQPVIVAENIASFSTSFDDTTLDVQNIHAGFFKSATHREDILNTEVREAGIGLSAQVDPQFLLVDATEDFAAVNNSPVFLTGVLYKDKDGDNFYSIGEGIGGITVTATNLDSGKVFTTTTGAAGGYGVAVPAGHYSVTILGMRGTVTIGSTSVKVDYRTNAAGGSPQLLGVSNPTLVKPSGPRTPDRVGLFRDGTWILDSNNNHQYDSSDAVFTFGLPGDVPITGDWNGDGITDVGVFRNVGGVGEFILDSNGNHQFDANDDVFYFGLGTDHIVIGDWNGDGRDKVGVYRDNGAGVGLFSLDTNGSRTFDAGDAVFRFGLASDNIVIGDWNGDGRDKVGVYRNDGLGVARWSLDSNGDHLFDAGDAVFRFGLATDNMVIGDWNADGRSKAGVMRDNGQGAAIWSLDSNGNLLFDATDQVFTYGLSSDKPVIGKW